MHSGAAGGTSPVPGAAAGLLSIRGGCLHHHHPCLALGLSPIAHISSPSPPQPSLTTVLHLLYSLASSSSTPTSFLSKFCPLSRLISPFYHALDHRPNQTLVTQQPRRSKKTALGLHFSADSVTEMDRSATPDLPIQFSYPLPGCDAPRL